MSFQPVRKSISESDAPDDTSPSPLSAESSGERSHRHAIELASRRWRRRPSIDAPQQFDLCTATDRVRPLVFADAPVVVRVHLRQGLVEELRIQEVLELGERTCA